MFFTNGNDVDATTMLYWKKHIRIIEKGKILNILCSANTFVINESFSSEKFVNNLFHSFNPIKQFGGRPKCLCRGDCRIED